jgi:hypothetical protein
MFRRSARATSAPLRRGGFPEESCDAARHPRMSVLPLDAPSLLVHVIPACRTFPLFLSITVVRIKLVRRTEAIYRARGGFGRGS